MLENLKKLEIRNLKSILGGGDPPDCDTIQRDIDIEDICPNGEPCP